jgi:hypothetical protein
MAMPLFWSVERDGDDVVANCPEPLRYASENRPEWMAHCASAIREELRALPIEDGTLLEATLTGEPPPGADLENILLYNVGIPEAHVHAGVRLRRLPAGTGGVAQRYRRVSIVAVEDEGGDAVLAAFTVPVDDGQELESARAVWLAARRAAVASLPEGELLAAAGIDLRVRVVTGTGRMRGSIERIKKLLDGVCASLHVYAGANLDEVARRLALELGESAEAMTALLVSPRGTPLGPYDFLWLRGERVQLSPADDRIHAAEVMFIPGGTSQLAVELRAILAA